MHLGTMIDYKLRIHGFPVRWRSEITAWEPPDRALSTNNAAAPIGFGFTSISLQNATAARW